MEALSPFSGNLPAKNGAGMGLLACRADFLCSTGGSAFFGRLSFLGAALEYGPIHRPPLCWRNGDFF
jgi:hypothetical protein